MSLKILKIVTIVGPAVFIALFELSRHIIFVERQPMVIGNLLVFVAVIIGAFFFSRFIFGIIERTQRESLRRNQELAALNSVALAVSESLNLDVVLYRALDKVLQVSGAEAGEMFLFDEETQEMVRRVHAGLFPEAFQEKTRFRLGEGFAGGVAQSGEPIVLPDLADDARLLRGKVREHGFRSLACVPLKLKNAIIGAINVFSLKPGRFAPDDIRLLANIGNQIAVAIENARLHEKVQGMAALEERERIAREMHDSLAQVLGYVNTKTQAARKFLTSGQKAKAKAQLMELENIAQEVYADVREAILGLRSTATPERDMVSTLKEYVFRFSQMSGIKAELEIENGNLPSLPTATELQVIRIIQEALTNVRKHARASHAWVRISTDNEHLEIIIGDNGQGFNVSSIRRADWPQFGLQTMKERAESVRGTLDISSAPSKGTTVTLKIPLQIAESPPESEG
ncbi:MAG TPA: GAF domain-containing sensor histidine kinase [Dehalococcoidia bacterium]|nr:GAF domain-containing sensor histidine kinase [Dehalococcoidia bacterium]